MKLVQLHVHEKHIYC